MFLKRQGKPDQFIYVAQLHRIQAFTRKFPDKSQIKIKIKHTLGSNQVNAKTACRFFKRDRSTGMFSVCT